jgi:hypothetical protein
MIKAKKPTTKKSAGPVSKPVVPTQKKPAKPRIVAVSNIREMSGEELVIENFAAVSRLVETLRETLELLTQKVENMAYHIIATEEVLAELVADNGINLAHINTRIRYKIATGTGNQGDPDKAIDVAASIVSPLPRR